MSKVLAINDILTGNNDEYREIKRAISGEKESFCNLIKRNKLYLYKTAYMYVQDEDKFGINEVVITPFEIKVITQHDNSKKDNYYVKFTDENNKELDRTYQSFDDATSTSSFNRDNFNWDKLTINIYNPGYDKLLFKKEININ